MASGRRKRGGHHEEHPDERWLLTYADMITLLTALFIVLWSISSVNNSKLDILKQTLQDAFDGAVVTGGKAAMDNGASMDPNVPAPIQASASSAKSSESAAESEVEAAAREEEELEKLKERVEAAARREGVEEMVRTDVTGQGLRVRLLTDRVLFDSGHAELKPGGAKLIDAMAAVLRTAPDRRIRVDGHTDSVPLRGGPYTDNWGLSAARSTAVVRRLQQDGFNGRRLAAGGHADNRPVASNKTNRGRAQNRRVEILLGRKDGFS